ncbi:Ig-like domain-containing protein [Barnesiella viscericola]|uniref:Ig-like domain-containing protein n=1 Tax=Barnesiella viscericola TaxID=397865 RepID=UPI002354E85D|nr:Ig-like domain-containing protein [Barnesiella viscericola]
MKRYSIIFFLAIFFGVTIFSACEEEATLDGATEVYITINPTDISLSMGDTVKISAAVTNLSGKVIKTPITWSIADKSVATLLGDTAIIAVNGGQGKETTLKAMLENGKYAITSVLVSRNLPEGVTCVANDSTLAEMTTKRSYNIAHDSILFAVSPKSLLYDYEPVATIEGEVTAYDPEITIDTVKGLVAVHYAAPRSSGEGKITLSIGESSTAKSASCDIVVAPQLLATFYGDDYANMPYLGTRPGKEVLSMYYAYTYEKEMDINTEDTLRIAMNIQSGAREDIVNGYNAYRWEIVSGGSIVIAGKENEYVENEGFDAVLRVRSGVEEGETEHCITSDTVFVATFRVQDFKNRYPVEEITVDKDPISMPVGGTVLLTTGVIPASSYAYHKPVVTAADSTKVSVGSYDGNVIPIRGLALGSTELILTSNGKEKRVPVTVTEGIHSVLWVSGNARTIFAGQTVQWGVDARTSSGGENPYEVTWHSSNPDAVKAEPTPVDNKHGTITGLAVGSSDVTAEVAGVSSDVATVRVIELPVNLNLTATNTDKQNSAIYDESGNLVVLVTPTSGYELITLTLPFSGSSYDGQYSLAGATLNIDGAETEVTSGSLTVATAGGQTTVSYNLSGNVGGKMFSIEAVNVPVSL